jgi:N-acetylneuraminate synthase/sialic acid synthase
MVRDLRRVRVSVGDGVKRTYESEVAPMVKMGKKLVAAHDMPSGHSLTKQDIAIKSPGDCLEPFEIDKVIGRVTICELKKDDDITFSVLNGYQTEI